MSATRFSSNDAPPRGAVDAAAALLQEEYDGNVAPPSGLVEEQPSPAPQRPARPQRGPDGRFAPRDEQPAPQPEAQPQQPQQAPPDDDETIDYRTLAQQQAEELERHRRNQQIYYNNVEQQRQALETARREAAEARAAAERAKVEGRESVLEELRNAVQIYPQGTPQYFEALRDLTTLERRYFDEDRQAAQRQAEEQEQERQQSEQARANDAAKIGAWGTLQAYAAKLGQHLNLTSEETLGVLQEFQTDDLREMFVRLPGEAMAEHIRRNVGPRFERALRSRAASKLEENRQQVVQSGVHSQPGQPQVRPAQPASEQYTWNGSKRLGVEAAANFLMAGGLDDED